MSSEVTKRKEVIIESEGFKLLFCDLRISVGFYINKWSRHMFMGSIKLKGEHMCRSIWDDVVFVRKQMEVGDRDSGGSDRDP